MYHFPSFAPCFSLNFHPRTTQTSPDFLPVDGGVGRACRGATTSDNNPSHYQVVSGSENRKLGGGYRLWHTCLRLFWRLCEAMWEKELVGTVCCSVLFVGIVALADCQGACIQARLHLKGPILYIRELKRAPDVSKPAFENHQ